MNLCDRERKAAHAVRSSTSGDSWSPSGSLAQPYCITSLRITQHHIVRHLGTSGLAHGPRPGHPGMRRHEEGQES